MQGLPVCKHDVIGNVYYIINRTKPYGTQTLLQPFGALLHLAIGQRHRAIAGACLGVLHHNINVHVMIIYGKSRHIRTVQRRFMPVAHQPGIQIAGNAIMRAGIGTVGRNIHFNQPITLDTIVIGGAHPHGGVVRQNDNPVMARTNANFVFGTYHPKAFNAAQFRLFDGYAVVSVIKLRTKRGHDYFLPRCHVGSAAYDLLRFSRTEINRTHMHMIGIGMRVASDYAANYQPLQPSFHALYLFNASYFQTNGS